MTVQSIFDDIMPNILCLGAFGVVFYLLKKEVKPLAILGGTGNCLWDFWFMNWDILEKEQENGYDAGLYI